MGKEPNYTTAKKLGPLYKSFDSLQCTYTTCRVHVIAPNVRIYSMNYGNGGGAAGLHWNNDFNEWVIKDLIILQKLRNYNLEVPL